MRVQVLGIALTDTFGTPAFLRAFKKQMQITTTPLPSAAGTVSETTSTGTTPPVGATVSGKGSGRTYAEAFAGVRQDSGDPLEFIKIMRTFYDEQGIKDKKTMVFSDSLNLELCKQYKAAADAQGFQPTFGVGTFFTSKFLWWCFAPDSAC